MNSTSENTISTASSFNERGEGGHILSMMKPIIRSVNAFISRNKKRKKARIRKILTFQINLHLFFSFNRQRLDKSQRKKDYLNYKEIKKPLCMQENI